MDTARPHLVIVGGGFAGLWATRGLASAPLVFGSFQRQYRTGTERLRRLPPEAHDQSFERIKFGRIIVSTLHDEGL